MTTIDKLNKYECDKEIRHYNSFLFSLFGLFIELDEIQAAYAVKFLNATHRAGEIQPHANYVQEQNIKHINTY